MINSRDINELTTETKKRCIAFVAMCKAHNIDIIITSTYRDMESQAALYAQGRTKPGDIVTDAKPGQSFHNFRVAFDFAPVLNGKLQYNNAKLIEQCGILAEKSGLEWSGRWKKRPERVHCQLSGLSLATLQKQQNLLRLGR